MKSDQNSLEQIEQIIFKLPFQQQLELIGKMVEHLREQNFKSNDEEFDWEEFYGIAKGLWNEDAQEYVNHLREDR
jgi:hypothetical protein